MDYGASNSFHRSKPSAEFLNPTILSRKEYLKNRVQKRTNIISVKPESEGMIDKRLRESGFHHANERTKSLNVARDSKAMRLNRR